MSPGGRTAALPPEAVLPLHRAGIEAVEAVTAGFADDDWARPACGDWDAADTARHVVAVARWYHAWLDRALAGDPARPFAEADLPARNQASLAAVGDLDGPTAVAEFAASARAYGERARDAWDVAYGYPSGTVTTGLHLGIAATEWHLHAWDLARAVGRPYEPADPAALLLAASRCVAATKGSLGGAALRALAPLGARARPWPTLLKESGRRP